MKYLAIAVSVMAAATVLSDAEQFVRAWQQWERQPTLGSLLHVATSGLFLAEDVAALR